MKYKSKIFRQFEFTQQFFRFLLLDRIMIKKDNLVLITGKRGDGKTTMALKIINGFSNIEGLEEYYNKELNKRKEEKKEYKLNNFTPFNLETDMAFTRKGLQDLCKNLTRGFILADEAIVNAARKNTMTKANKLLHEVLTINRKNGNSVFFCLPSIEDFDISMLQYVTHWIHIDDRGLACVLMPEAKSIFGRKTWDVDGMKKTYDKFKEANPTLTSVPYWLFNNFRGYIRFRALTRLVEERYLKLANEKKNAETDIEIKLKDRAPRIPQEKMDILEALTTKLMSGELTDSAEYYASCENLRFNKARLNKEVNELLAKRGDGRTANRVIKENVAKYRAENDENLEANRGEWKK